MRTSSANPDKLDRAAAAVPAGLGALLTRAPSTVQEAIAGFERQAQEPRLVEVDRAAIVAGVFAAVREGHRIDRRLIELAAAFRTADTAGHTHAPVGPDGVITRYDRDIAELLVRWSGFEEAPWFRDHSWLDGEREVRGPSDRWYRLSPTPPPGAEPLTRLEGVFDLGNPEHGKNLGPPYSSA